MNIKQIIINLARLLKKDKPAKVKIAPDKLPPDIMAEVMQEVDFLRNEHSVDVRTLEPNEVPSIPKHVKE